MKVLILIWILGSSADHDVGAINQQIRIAESAQASSDYQTALQAYRMLYHKLKYSPDEIILNYAHCFYKLGQKDSAAFYYSLLTSAPPATATVACQQLGNIAAEKQDINSALEYFKSALRADHTNEEARYNYEVLKRQKQQQDKNQQKNNDQNQQNDKKQQQQQPNKDNSQNSKENNQNEQKQDTNKDSKPQNQNNAQREQKDQSDKPNEQQRYQQIQISPEQARMIMDALRSNEIKYYQQMQKKPQSKPDKNKPDW